MKKIFILQFLFLLSGGAAHAAPKSTAPAPVSGEIQMKKPSTKGYKQFSIGFLYWQEDVKLTSPADSALMRTHFQGLELGYAYNKFFKDSYWRASYKGTFGYGEAKGTAEGSVIAESLSDQTWISGGFTPGIFRRTAPVSEVGFIAPIMFRGIKWKNDTSTGTEVEKKGSLSVGLGLQYVNRFSRRSSFYGTVSYQMLWHSTQFGAGWTYTFK